MGSQVDVVNTALGALGQEPVADLSAASLAQSAAAVKLMRSIETARETVLRRHGWYCALEYASLAPSNLAGYSNWRYPLVFVQPAGCLRVWEVAGNICDGRDLGFDEPRWEFGTFETKSATQKIIRVGRNWGGGWDNGGGQLDIAYIRHANWASLDPHVADAVAYDCAARQAQSIRGDKQLTAAIASEAEKRVMMAISVDSTQSGGQPSLAPSIPAQLRAYANGAGAGGDFGGRWGGW